MSRTAWIAVSLLVVTNAVWAAMWLGREDPQSGLVVESDDEIAELREEVESLRVRAEAAELLAPPEGGALRPAGTMAEEDAAPAELSAAAKAEADKAALAARAKQDADNKARASALEQAKSILKKVMQVEDAAVRSEGLAELADALRSQEPYLVEYTLSALWAARDIDIDRAHFAKLVGVHLDSEDSGIRRSALYVNYAMDPERADVRLAIASASDEAEVVRQHAGRILALYTGKHFEGETADAMAELLADESLNVRRGTVRGIAGAHISPEIEDRLIEMATRPAERHDAVQYGLSTVPDKSRKVVDALFTYLTDENHGIRGRAHWGLQRGIPKEERPYVAKRYAEHLTKFVNPKSHREALQLIAKYGDVSVAPKIEAFARNEMVDEKVRVMARKVVEYLENKKPDR